MKVKIFIGGFPLDMEELELAKMVSPHGEIVTMQIVRDKKTRLCKGYAFLEMAGEDDAVGVMAALDGEKLGDRLLSVKLADIAPASTPTYQKASRSNNPAKNKRPRRQV